MTRNIFPISFPFLFWSKTITMMLGFGNNQNIHYWEGKSDFPKLCVPQKYGDLYVISYLIINLDILHAYATPILQTLISTPFENNTSGKYITPPIYFLKTFWKQLSYDLRQLIKTSSCHNWVWSFYYKMILLIMKMVLWLMWFELCGNVVMWILWCLLLVRIIPQLCLKLK